MMEWSTNGLENYQLVNRYVETYYKDTFALLISGLIVMIIFGWILKKEISKFRLLPRNKRDKFMFLLENIFFLGGISLGVILLLIAFFG